MRNDKNKLTQKEHILLYSLLDKMDYEQLDALLLSVSVRQHKKYEEWSKK